MKYPLVIVRWNDAHTAEATQYAVADVPHSPLVIETVGWLLRDDDAGISLVSERLDNAQYRGYTFVPRGMVVEGREVTRPRRKRAPKQD